MGVFEGMGINELEKKQIAFNKVADCIEEHRDEIISVLCEIETYVTAENEVDKTIRALRTYHKEQAFLLGRKPSGIIAVFLPYNMPLYSLVLYAFGPIYAGNKVLVRPSKMTGGQLKAIVDILGETTDNLDLEIVETGGRLFLERITADKDISTIIFTGQWESVIDISNNLPENKKLIYCGSGVCPMIVRKKADIQVAVDVAIKSRFFNTGQDCLSTERILVHSDCFDVFVEELLRRIRGISPGENINPGTVIGPLISESIAQRALELVYSSSGTILYESEHSGCVVGPIVVEAASPEEDVFIYEKFAPVFTLLRVDTDEEMVRIANESEHILGVTVIGDEYPLDAFVAQHVEYNRSILEQEEDDAHVPFGGFRKSGFVMDSGGRREGPILFSIETTN